MVTVLVATALRLAIEPLIQADRPFLLYFGATAVAGWFGGFRAGLLATVLGALAATYLFVPPRQSLLLTPATALQVTLFVTECLLLTWIVRRLQLAEEHRAALLERERASRAEEHRQAEALQRSEERYRLLSEALPHMVWTMTPEGRVDHVNRRWIDYTGASLDDLDRQGWELVVHPDDIGSLRALVLDRLARGETYEVEFRMRRADGAYRWMIGRSLPLRDPGGRLLTWIGTTTDIHARRETEEALRRREHELRLVANAIPALVSSIDAQQRYQFVNTAYEQWFGHPSDEILGRTMRDVLGEAAYERLQPHVEAALAGRPVTFEALVPYRDGGTRHIRASYVPHLQPDDRVAGFYVFVVDQTEAKNVQAELARHAIELARANAELKRSNAELERYAYVASHDLQEPLRTVAAYTELLARRYGTSLDAEGSEMVGYVAQACLRMTGMIRGLLELSRVGRHGAVEPVHAGEVLGEALLDLDRVIRERGAVVRTGTLPVVDMDRAELRQVFLNLVGNALKFADGRPEVEVSARALLGEWQFTVRDNGIGIPPEHLERIFVLFQRLHPRQYPGTGLGLALCKKVVEGRGGRIWAESDPGLGSAFHFTIPASSRAAA